MPEYTLKLFQILLDKTPTPVNDAVKEEGRQKYEQLAAGGAGVEEIEQEMIRYGKQIWPYLRAEFDLMEKYGEEKRQEYFLASLPAQLKDKWIQFEKQGGNIHNYKQAKDYEQAFDADEDRIISENMVEARNRALKYVRRLEQQDKQEEFSSLVEKYRREEAEILEKIIELKSYKERGEKWDKEIEELVNFFEKGFAGLEERPTVEKVRTKIDWYEGQIQAGNI